jgi:MarR family transcriptional regulator for hemolysin
MDELDQTLMHLTMALTKAARVYKAAADRMASDYGLSQASAWPVVMIGRIGKGQGVRPSAVAERLDIEHSSLVRIIDQLIDAGLVERHDDPDDRRAKLLFLTAEGKKRSQQLERALSSFRRTLFKDIGKDDIDASQRMLDALQRAMTDFTGKKAS